MIRKSQPAIKENVGFVPAQKYYEILQDLLFDMLESAKTNDMYKVIDTYEELYLITLPFTRKHMKKEDYIVFDDLSPLYKILDRLKPEDSDINIRQNNAVIMEAKRKINQRKKMLYGYMAKARLFVPLLRDTGDLPAALAGDEM